MSAAVGVSNYIMTEQIKDWRRVGTSEVSFSGKKKKKSCKNIHQNYEQNFT